MQAPPPAPRPEWAYFFDIDGTLSELAATPASARVAPELSRRLADVRAATDGAVAVVSGRALADIDAMFGETLPAAGQHGAERRDAMGRMHHAALDLRRAMRVARDAIAGSVAQHPGLLLEDKGYALALHYRAAPRMAAYARKVMQAQHTLLGPRFAVQLGKRVVELLPAGIDKGTAIRAFLDEPPFKGRLPVFLGDDVTDEAGFAAVEACGGHTVKVGAGVSRARYRLPGVAAVGQWLAGVSGGAGASDGRKHA